MRLTGGPPWKSRGFLEIKQIWRYRQWWSPMFGIGMTQTKLPQILYLKRIDFGWFYCRLRCDPSQMGSFCSTALRTPISEWILFILTIKKHCMHSMCFFWGRGGCWFNYDIICIYSLKACFKFPNCFMSISSILENISKLLGSTCRTSRSGACEQRSNPFWQSQL